MARKNREPLEERALEIIRSSEDGILQSDLCRKLEVSSKEGARIVSNLERKGLIRRERILHSSRWTYKLIIVDNESSYTSIEYAPCILCEKDSLCGVGGDTSHLKCRLLEEWVLNQRME
ncbi:MAG: MarR family transcriptional regulator [Nitrososphaerota archaeon]|nr:MarR family transcriptional regulator [Candidatus Bathyarchaeota archaeon]MCX8162219.1 MarR family transcriptional regulator [Candidatus Bathyarchaeota archaeon]MDW8061958.1 MarR family transcriptional regulator [Nitrososphaerota archaeon]